MMPKDENEGQHMVNTAIQYDDGPIAMRFPRGNGLGFQWINIKNNSNWNMGSVKRG